MIHRFVSQLSIALSFFVLMSCTQISRAQEKAKDPDNYDGDRKTATVKDPANFYQNGKRLYSGPQAGEKLPTLDVVGVGGKLDEKDFDAAELSNETPILIALIDDSELGGKTTYFLGQLSETIEQHASGKFRTIVIYVGDDPETIQKEVASVRKYLPKHLMVAYARSGRDGPGSYGLNRNVPVTMIVAHKRKVLHNFSFGQHVFQIDPYVAGGVAEALKVDRKTFISWLAKKSGDKKMMSKESTIDAWVGWAKKASPDEVSEALASQKFAKLSNKEQAAIKKAIDNLTGK